MVAITKDERRVNKAQTLYDNGLDKYLDMIALIDKDVDNIKNLIHGYALGKPDVKYQLTVTQYNALKDQLNTWKAHNQNPEKVLSQINDGLKKKFGQQNNPVMGTTKPNVAIFSPKAV